MGQSILYARLRQLGQRVAHLPKYWRQIALYALFVLIATILWYFTKLSHEYTVDISQRVVLQHQPPGRLLVGARERNVLIRLHGRGYSLVKYKNLAFLSPLVINLRDFWHQFQFLSPDRGYLTAQKLEQIFASQLPAGIQLDKVLTDSLECGFSPLVTRKLPVRLAIAYSMAPQYTQLSRTAIFPDSVWVSGPLATVDSMTYVPTDSLNIGVLYDNYQCRVRLRKQYAGVDYDRASVEVRIPVVQFTQKRVNVPIESIGAPDSLVVTFIPRSVEISCNVPISHYNDLTERSFRLTAAFSPYGRENKLLVSLDSVPDFAFNVDFQPKYVKFLISKQQ